MNILDQKHFYTIAEIGINHNGDIRLAKKLIKVAKDCGFDSVKFQKRNPDDCVPKDKRSVMRTTPWGTMTYFDYKKKIEFWEDEYDEINEAITRRTIEQAIQDINAEIGTLKAMQQSNISKSVRRHQFLLMGVKHG